MKNRLVRFIVPVALATCAMAQPALAVTECSVHVTRIFSGDRGNIWLYFDTGGSGYMAANDPNREAILALAITAKASGLAGVVRYSADGVACSAGSRSDLVGFFLG